MTKTVITSDKAPAAIGTYSQAIKAGNTVYMSGQIPLDPKTMELVEGFEAQTVQVFENLKAVAEAAGGSFKDIVKLNIFLTDLSHFAMSTLRLRCRATTAELSRPWTHICTKLGFAR